MEAFTLTILAGIGVISLICQWVAWRLRLPAILFLLIAGIAIGPVAGVLQPEQMFGDLLFPIVSLSVAVILFEGSLTLQFKEIQGMGKMLRNLLSIGPIINWVVGALACRITLGISWDISLLFGAIIVVTGPTVIMPMLRAVRPNARVTNILKWEGIIIDPIGALLAVLVFEFIIAGKKFDTLGHAFVMFGQTVSLGIVLGCLSGYLLGLALRQHWLPQFLQNAGSLTFMLGIYALSNALVHESGLLTVTVMGIWLANMRGVPVDEILEFKESLSVLLISALFIILAARIDFQLIAGLGFGPILVIMALMLIARPLGVWISARGTPITMQEQLFLSWVAPRGIVAAAVSALFAFRLESQGHPDAALLVPLVFLVIIATVIIQSLTATALARKLNVIEPATSGYIFIGANSVSRAIAKVLQGLNLPVLLTDTNWENIRQTRMESLPVYFGNPMSEHAENHMDMTGIGYMMALSPYKQLNTLATFHFLDLFGKGHVYGLSEGDTDQKASHQLSDKYKATRRLFGESVTFAKLASLLAQGAKIRTTQITANFSMEHYKAQHGNRLLMLFYLNPQKQLMPVEHGKDVKIAEGWQIISLIQPEPASDPVQEKQNGSVETAKNTPKKADTESEGEKKPTNGKP